jgi:hypothetical protein
MLLVVGWVYYIDLSRSETLTQYRNACVELIERVLQGHGGWQHWANVELISFNRFRKIHLKPSHNQFDWLKSPFKTFSSDPN